jgi:cbb3-type cytochrome oxidase subunit 3
MKVSLALVIIFSILIVSTASAYELVDTTIYYTDYKEITSNTEAIIYKLRITNTANTPQTYEIIPDSEAIKAIGTYRIEPSTTARIKSYESQTFEIYVYPEKQVNGRVAIPIQLTSANATTTLELAARTNNPLAANSSTIRNVLKAAFYTLIILILIALIVSTFRKNKDKRKREDEEKPEVEEYY